MRPVIYIIHPEQNAIVDVIDRSVWIGQWNKLDSKLLNAKAAGYKVIEYSIPEDVWMFDAVPFSATYAF